MTTTVKCVLIGDGASGKTCMVLSYLTSSFPYEYSPTVYDNRTQGVIFEGKPFQLQIADTSGQYEYEKLRPISYTKADVVIICYGVDSYDQYSDVLSLWAPEAKFFAPWASVLLVGTKIDLREVSATWTFEDGQYLASQMDAVAYMECSALTQQGLKEVFQAAVKIAWDARQKGSSDPTCCCSVM